MTRIKITESVDARNARLSKAEREVEIARMKVSATERLATYKKMLGNMIGDGQYLIYTGEVDCPVWVKLNEERNGVMPNVGLDNATHLTMQHAARFAPLIRNGNNEVAHFCTYRKAIEMEIANVTKLLEWLNGDSDRKTKVKKALAA